MNILQCNVMYGREIRPHNLYMSVLNYVRVID